jgi:hypothetical protein
MLSVEAPEAFLSTAQLIAVFWFYDKATRTVLEKVKNKGFKYSVGGLRIHHWLIGIIIAILGFFILSIQNIMILLHESGLLGLPIKMSSGTITMGLRIFIDDLKDMKKQIRNLLKR